MSLVSTICHLCTVFTLYYSLLSMLSIVLFVSCLIRVIVPLENFSLLWRRHHNWWRTAKFDPCPAHMTIEQWGFFNMPHLLWHGAWSSPRTRDTHTHCQAFGSWAVTTCFYDLGPSRLEFDTQPSARGPKL